MQQINIWKYHTKKQVKQIFNQLSKQIVINNDFFHYTDYQIKRYLENNILDLEQRFQRFYYSWNRFENKKRIIQRFYKKHIIEYPQIFQKQQRIVIDEFEIDYSNILQYINYYRASNKKIPCSYQILLKKIIKSILFNEIFNNKKITYSINILENKIYIQQQLNQNKFKNIVYNIDKLILKYQKRCPLKYKKCKAKLIISSNWKDLLLQSTFKQWTSCLNLFVDSSDETIVYSSTNGIKAGNLVAYCLFELDDGKTIQEIMDDNGYHKLMYQRSFWRCSIKRYVNINNYNNYLFCAQHTSYGTIMQNYITYKYKLFTKLNKWLLELNNNICKIIQPVETFKLPYNVYSDLHSFNLDVQKKCIYLFNINQTSELSKKTIKKIKDNINFNIKLFSNDILALLSIFKYFQQNKLQLKTQQSRRDYIVNNYMLNSHYVLNNTIKAKKKLNLK